MTNSNVELKRFGSAHALESEVAGDIAAELARAIAARRQASLLGIVIPWLAESQEGARSGCS
jgi:hypothetical protein